MKKNLLWLVLIFISIAVIFYLASKLFIGDRRAFYISKAGNQTTSLSINGWKLQVETVTTPEKRALGLSGRSVLCRTCGMLFIFPKKGQYSFWMKDMLIDLDIIWISGDEVVYIAKNIPHQKGAESINPNIEADKVLEIGAGQSDVLKLKVGDLIKTE